MVGGRARLLAPGKAAEVLAISPGELAEMGAASPEVVLDLAADGSLILMPSTSSETGGRYGALSGLLWQPLCRRGLRMKLFDSSTGFRLPYNFVLSPYLVVELANPNNQGPRGLRLSLNNEPPLKIIPWSGFLMCGRP